MDLSPFYKIILLVRFSTSLVCSSTDFFIMERMRKLPNYTEYQKSVAAEFLAYEKRIRYLIDDNHWPEEGRYKEIILMNYLKRVLPKPISVGTGFIRNKDSLTSQIDIIIYDQSHPLLFSEGDFIIAVPDNVLGIIEVKSTIKPSELCSIIKKANNNASIICGGKERHLFNGVFSYNKCISATANTYIQRLKSYDYKTDLEKDHFNKIVSSRLFSYVNHITLGTRYFIKLWPLGVKNEEGKGEWEGEPPHYSFYDMKEGLAFSYFLSNLQEITFRNVTGQYNEELPGALSSLYYPLKGGKDTRLVSRIELK